MKVLVTGGAGFIGSHMTRRLLDAGYDVVVLDHRIAGKCLDQTEIDRLIDAVEGDVTNAEIVRLAAAGCERIFHFAALVGVDHYTREPVRTMQVEERALSAVCSAAMATGCGKVLYASSSAVYGNTTGLVDEGQEVSPVSNYAVAKRFNELFLESQWKQNGLQSVSCRIFNVYGPGQDERLVIPRFIRLGLAGQPLAINGNGSQCRDFPFVGDVTKAMLRCSEEIPGCEVVNIATGQSHSIRALAETVIRLTDGHSSLEYRPVPAERKVFEVDSCIGSTAKLKRLTGFLPSTSLEAGLEQTVAHIAARVTR